MDRRLVEAADQRRTTRELAQVVGVATSTARRALLDLEQRGRVVRAGRCSVGLVWVAVGTVDSLVILWRAGRTLDELAETALAHRGTGLVGRLSDARAWKDRADQVADLRARIEAVIRRETNQPGPRPLRRSS